MKKKIIISASIALVLIIAAVITAKLSNITVAENDSISVNRRYSGGEYYIDVRLSLRAKNVDTNGLMKSDGVFFDDCDYGFRENDRIIISSDHSELENRLGEKVLCPSIDSSYLLVLDGLENYIMVDFAGEEYNGKTVQEYMYFAEQDISVLMDNPANANIESDEKPIITEDKVNGNDVIVICGNGNAEVLFENDDVVYCFVMTDATCDDMMQFLKELK